MPISGYTMLFHDAQGGSIRIADDVDAEDSSSIWVRLDEPRPTLNSCNIVGSTGKLYKVTIHGLKWSCTCTGFAFRRHCKHLDEAKRQHKL